MAPAKPVPDSLRELRAALDAMRERLASTPERSGDYVELYVSCTDLLCLVEARIRELDPDAALAAEQLASVCILLGPYRNLTTLTSSVLGLHPQCAVLNHAGRRTLRNPRLNFLANRSLATFAEFVRYAGFAARAGARGMHGGDIRLSHAFDRAAMREADAKLRGARAEPARCLVWKESQHVGNFLRAARIDVRELLAAIPRLRFLLPIRNPIDCAMSNLRRGHVHALGVHHGVSKSSALDAVVAAVLDEIAWFFALRDASGRPDCFCHYFEHEMGRELLERLLRFLDLPADETYFTTAAEVFKADPAPGKDARVLERYAELVRQKFAQMPELRDSLLRFAR